MAALIGSLIHETTTVTGTGAATISAANARRRFSDQFATGGSNTLYYAIIHRTLDEWEYGTGSISDADTLVRDTIIASSNSNNAVSFSAGTKDVICDHPAEFQLGGDTPRLSASLDTNNYDITPATAPLFLGTTAAEDIWLFVNDYDRYWLINGTTADLIGTMGQKINLSPSIDAVYTGLTIDNNSTGTNSFARMELIAGTGSALEIYTKHSSARATIGTTAGSLRFSTETADDMEFLTNDEIRWTIDGTTGDFTSTDADLTVGSTSAGATGAILTFNHASASPAVNDILSSITTIGKDSNAATQNYSYIRTKILDPTASSEAGTVEIGVVTSGHQAPFSVIPVDTDFGSIGGSGVALYFTSTDKTTGWDVYSSGDGSANPLAYVSIGTDSSSPADNDNLGFVSFYGPGDTGNYPDFGLIGGIALDVTAGTEDGALYFNTMVAGTLTRQMTIGNGGIAIGTGTTFPGAGNLAFATAKGIFDDAANELLLFTKVVSATNYLGVSNRDTGHNPYFYAGGSDSNVGIEFTVQGNPTAPAISFNTGAGDFSQVVFYNNSAGTAGAVFKIWQDSASPAVGDQIGKLSFVGNNTSAAQKNYGGILGKILDPVNATGEDGEVLLNAMIAGTETTVLKVSDGVIIGTGTVYPGAGNLRVTNIELGSDTDTTFARKYAGVATIEGSGIETRNKGHIWGLTLSRPSTSTITIAAGEARDDTGIETLVLAAGITKSIASGWAVGDNNGGLNTGAEGSSTWYEVHLIKRVDTGVVDVMFTTTANRATLPANYTLKRRIGWVRNDGSSNFLAFTQLDDHFTLTTQINDGAFTATSTEAAITMTVPPNCVGRFRYAMDGGTAGTNLYNQTEVFSEIVEGSVTPAVTTGIATVTTFESASTVISQGAGHMELRVSATSTIRHDGSANANTGAGTVDISTFGWIDTRERLSAI